MGEAGEEAAQDGDGVRLLEIILVILVILPFRCMLTPSQTPIISGKLRRTGGLLKVIREELIRQEKAAISAKKNGTRRRLQFLAPGRRFRR